MAEQLDLFPEGLERINDLKETKELVRALLEKIDTLQKDVEELKKRPVYTPPLNPLTPIGPGTNPPWPRPQNPWKLPDTNPTPRWPLDVVLYKDVGTPNPPFGNPSWSVCSTSNQVSADFSDVRDLLSYPADIKASIKLGPTEYIPDEDKES